MPVVNIASQMSWPIILAGLIFSFDLLLTVGIGLFAVVVFFQLITLPVEFDASRRGLRMMRECGMFTEQELKGSRKVLTAAALTYVAALASSVLTILRLLVLRSNRRR